MTETLEGIGARKLRARLTHLGDMVAKAANRNRWDDVRQDDAHLAAQRLRL